MSDEIKMSIRLPPELHARLAAAAEHDHRSKHGQMLHYVERGLDQGERAQKKGRTTSGTEGN
jgi:predicted transcriptional regulator